MQLICTHRISLQSSTPSHAYPIIGLPRKFRELAGSKADIYQTMHNRKLAFIVVVDKEVCNGCLPSPENIIEARFSALESTISALKSALFIKKACGCNEKRKSKVEGEIRTRVVASTGPADYGGSASLTSRQSCIYVS
jgi:hypothetical protein